MPHLAPSPTLQIALVGDYDPQVTAHQAIPRALELAAAETGLKVRYHWLATDSLSSDAPLQNVDGIWCVPASPYRSTDGALRAIRFARERQRPFLGTCGGFQHALLEYARNVLGWTDAEHGETHPEVEHALITPLACSLVETTDSIQLCAGSRIAQAYGESQISEGYRCLYGVNPQFAAQLLEHDLRPGGYDSAGDLRAVELRNQRFFVATLFQPERAALKGIVPPLVSALLAACLERQP
ncbi:CTP synthase C-terminal region-related (seleno)protein [Pseudomonas sp. NPDC089530]|uniref:CTP synthase C-terminal region-related (seleno)protein n=1 Tax=Pseudomonas sp. NPDC089530 TaxID=3390651 RepID=UPI003D02ABA5